MNPEDVQEHHAEEILDLQKQVEKLQEDNSIYTVVSFIGYKLGLAFSDPKAIQKVLNEVRADNQWSEKQLNFIDKLLEKVKEHE